MWTPCCIQSWYSKTYLKLYYSWRRRGVNKLSVKVRYSLIKSWCRTPDIYILYKGQLKFSKYSFDDIEKEKEEKRVSDLFSNRENFKEISPIQTFGSIDAITKDESDKWTPKYVYAIEECSIIALRFSEVKAKMTKLLRQTEYAEDSEFLRKNIPGLDNMIASNRNKIIQWFKKNIYPLPKMCIIKEGDIPNEKSKIRIIKYGECKIISNKVPMKLNAAWNTK